MEKCIVMFSGGLDSRLAAKIMQEKGFEPLLVYFQLPFGTGCCNERCSFNFSQTQGLKIKIFDCTKGELLKEYFKILKNPEYGRGTGMNPCVDCRIFMFAKTREFADKQGIKIIVTGEVIGQRPMSQQKKQIKIIEEESGLKGRIIRPLTELGIYGRKRDKQIELAKKFKINYPSPAGGCLLCEKALKNRFKFLFERGINDEELKLISIGRHFVIDNCWVVLGRDEQENKIIESFKEAIIPDYLGPSAVMLGNNPTTTTPSTHPKELVANVHKLIKAYSKQGSLEEREKVEKYKL